MRYKSSVAICVLAVLVLVSLCGCRLGKHGAKTSQTPDLTAPGTTEPVIIDTTFTTDVKMTRTGETTAASEPATEPPQTSGTTATTKTPPATTPPGGHALSVPPPSTDLRGLSESQVFAFFDDAVFVGDSISLHWRNEVIKKRQTNSEFMGKAQFLVSASLGAENSLWKVSKNSVHPSYNGEQMCLWESIPLTGAKKVFIMFGLNDVGRYRDSAYALRKAIENFGTLIGKIKENVPDAKFYILSATYVVKGGEKGGVTTENLRNLNIALIDFCAQNGYEFINIADALADTDGNLKPEYCLDKYVHLTSKAYDVWAALLKGFAASKLAG